MPTIGGRATESKPPVRASQAVDKPLPPMPAPIGGVKPAIKKKKAGSSDENESSDDSDTTIKKKPAMPLPVIGGGAAAKKPAPVT